MTKQICHLTTVHPYNDTRIFYKECRSLVEAGYSVILIAPVDVDFQEMGVRVISAGSWRTRWERIYKTLPRLLYRAVKCRADVYHFHDPEILLLVPILRMIGAKIIYDIHEDYVTSIMQKNYLPAVVRRPLGVLVRLLEKSLAALTVKVVAEKYYTEIFEDAEPILNYPISLKREAIAEIGDCGCFDPRYDWLLYCGNVHPDRGALTQLRLLEADRNLALAYIGKCPSRIAREIYDELDRRCIDRDRIRLVGVDSYIPRETIDRYMFCCRWLAGVALFPDTEHYRKKELTKLFEYMAAELPIIASDFPSWKLIVERAGVGECIAVDDMDRIKKVIKSLREDRCYAVGLGKRGARMVREKYSWSIEAKKLVSLYRRVLME